MKLILILWVLVSTSAVAQKVGYRNDYIGESYDTYKANNPPKPNNNKSDIVSFLGLGGCDDGIVLLCQQVSIEASTPGLIAYSFVKPELILKSIDATFDRSMFSSILEAIAAKYGKPTKSELQTYTLSPSGNQLKCEVVTWHLQGATITLSEWRDGADIRRNVGSFLIIDDAYAKQQKPHATF
jgi:hypothetical protein